MIKYYEYEDFGGFPEYVDLLESKYSGRIALREKKDGQWIAYTYEKLCTDIRAATYCLHDIIRGKHVAIIGEASHLWIVSAFATMCTKGVFIPIDKDMPPAGISAILKKSNADAVILSDSYAELRSATQTNIPVLLMSEIRAKIDSCKDKEGRIEKSIPPETLATIIFTSGTTGVPKGAMHSHGAIIAMIKSSMQVANFRGRLLYLLPIHHITGFELVICTYLLTGSEIYLNDSLQRLMKNITEVKPTEIFMVPVLMEGFYKMFKDDLSNMRNKMGGALQRLISGGAPLPVFLEEELPGKAGISVVNGYGLTECAPISVNGCICRVNGSIGYHPEFVEYAIAGDGEILAAGEIVTSGYYNEPELTKEASTEINGRRWFKTGDLGRIDENGFLFITGRKKNIIVLSNAENVSPEELEGLIKSRLPQVKEALVYAENDTIVAEVFPDPDETPNGDVIKEQIFAMNKELSLHKQFGKVTIRETEFPKNPMKKIIRKQQEAK